MSTMSTVSNQPSNSIKFDQKMVYEPRNLATRFKLSKPTPINDWVQFPGLNVKTTDGRGDGVFATAPIEAGTIIMEYAGVLKTKERWDTDAKGYVDRGITTNYGFSLHLNDLEYVVDATVIGNHARFINHSCNPNCVVKEEKINKRISLFVVAEYQVNVGDELTYEYGCNYSDLCNNPVKCLCGFADCKEWIGSRPTLPLLTTKWPFKEGLVMEFDEEQLKDLPAFLEYFPNDRRFKEKGSFIIRPKDTSLVIDPSIHDKRTKGGSSAFGQDWDLQLKGLNLRLAPWFFDWMN